MFGFEKVFWIIAIISSTVLAIQFVLALFGVDGHHSVDQADHSSDHDVSSFKLMTVRNVIAFFAMFGWSGLAMIHSGNGKLATFVVSFSIGTASMLFVAFLFYQISKLEQSGNIQINSLIGCTGTAYLNMTNNSVGKANITTKNSIIEVKAKSNEGEIKTGELVEVIQILNDNIVIVKKI